MEAFVVGCCLAVLVLLIMYWEWRDGWYMDRDLRLPAGVRVDGRARPEPRLRGR